jgi:hypothetical protein
MKKEGAEAPSNDLNSEELFADSERVSADIDVQFNVVQPGRQIPHIDEEFILVFTWNYFQGKFFSSDFTVSCR